MTNDNTAILCSWDQIREAISELDKLCSDDCSEVDLNQPYAATFVLSVIKGVNKYVETKSPQMTEETEDRVLDYIIEQIRTGELRTFDDWEKRLLYAQLNFW